MSFSSCRKTAPSRDISAPIRAPTAFRPGTCVPINPASPAPGCVVPYHDQNDVQDGAPHDNAAAMADIDNVLPAFRMDGFIARQLTFSPETCAKNPNNAACDPAASSGISRHDVAGDHTALEIPNYWA